MKLWTIRYTTDETGEPLDVPLWDEVQSRWTAKYVFVAATKWEPRDFRRLKRAELEANGSAIYRRRRWGYTAAEEYFTDEGRRRYEDVAKGDE